MNNGKIRKTIKVEVKKVLQESSLSRIWPHNHEHDCGAITAYRSAADCGNGKKYSHKDKQKRNKSLSAKLRSKGYGITKLSGKSTENGVIVSEIAFFVIDLNDTGDLEKDLKKIGKMFEQDSILFIPKKAIENKAKAYLVGTNHCPDNDLSYGKKMIFNKGKLGVSSPIYTSFVNGRPFIFEEVGGDCSFPGNGYGWWALHTLAKGDWQDIPED